MTSESVEETLEVLLRKRKKTRISTAAYSTEERKVLDQFKEEFQLQTSRQLRAQVFRSKILVAIYNYWKDNSMVPQSDEESLNRILVCFPFLIEIFIIYYQPQKLSVWLSNNWRPKVTLEGKRKMSIRCTKNDVLFREYRKDVDEEVRNLLDMADDEVVNYSNPEIFKLRTKATAMVFSNMSAVKKEEVLEKIEKYKKMGLPAEVQQQ
jgi:hypothetical protein